MTTAPERMSVSPSDPFVILAGIRQFGLAPDGSDLRDLEATIRSLSEGEWMPIETAPVETRILVYGPMPPTCGTKRDTPGGPMWAIDGWWITDGSGPTHWLPLPNPPPTEQDAADIAAAEEALADFERNGGISLDDLKADLDLELTGDQPSNEGATSLTPPPASVRLEPGWLARDIERAHKQAERWRKGERGETVRFHLKGAGVDEIVELRTDGKGGIVPSQACISDVVERFRRRSGDGSIRNYRSKLTNAEVLWLIDRLQAQSKEIERLRASIPSKQGEK